MIRLTPSSWPPRQLDGGLQHRETAAQSSDAATASLVVGRRAAKSSVEFGGKPGTGDRRSDRRQRPARPIVAAAASGRVVYAGSGLIGYGQLIIIKHNDTYLSAYGYNASLLVKEGEKIKKGQRIATMGEGPERKARLHFEIRRNGKPVNPRQYLPAR